LAEASNRGPLTERNRLIKENRVADYTSPNLALGMVPVEFGVGISRWVWRAQPAVALNPFGTLQGGYLTVFIDELLATAIASVLEDGEWAMTAEFKINFLRALSPLRWRAAVECCGAAARWRSLRRKWQPRADKSR